MECAQPGHSWPPFSCQRQLLLPLSLCWETVTQRGNFTWPSSQLAEGQRRALRVLHLCPPTTKLNTLRNPGSLMRVCLYIENMKGPGNSYRKFPAVVMSAVSTRCHQTIRTKKEIDPSRHPCSIPAYLCFFLDTTYTQWLHIKCSLKRIIQPKRYRLSATISDVPKYSNFGILSSLYQGASSCLWHYILLINQYHL